MERLRFLPALLLPAVLAACAAAPRAGHSDGPAPSAAEIALGAVPLHCGAHEVPVCVGSSAHFQSAECGCEPREPILMDMRSMPGH